MKRNADKTVKNSEMLSLASILSIVLSFFAVCVIAMLLLYRAGAYELPWFWNSGDEKSSSGQSGGTLEALFDEKNFEKNYSAINEDDEILKKLVQSVPSDTSFFARVSIMNVSDAGSVTEIYEIWRFGDKFRINKYDDSMSPKSVTLCDGITVNTTDSETGNTVSVPVSEQTAFEKLSPLPDFALISEEESRIIYTGSDGTEYEIICDFPSVSVISDVTISMSTGMMTQVKNYSGNDPVLLMQLLSYDGDIRSDSFLD